MTTPHDDDIQPYLEELGHLFTQHEQNELKKYAAQVRQRDSKNDWDTLHGRLKRRVVGSEELIDSLALVALSHRNGRSQRVLLTGPTGCGKTYAANALASSLDTPVLVVAVNELTEPGWGGGAHLADLLAGWRNQHKVGVEYGVLVLDELDKLAPRSSHPTNSEKYTKMQASLLPLLGRSPAVLGDNAQLMTSGLTVVCCGAFSGTEFSAQGRAPTSEELVQYGRSERRKSSPKSRLMT